MLNAKNALNSHSTKDRVIHVIKFSGPALFCVFALSLSQQDIEVGNGGELPICFALTLALQILCEERGVVPPQRPQGPHNLEKEHDRKMREFNTLRA